jgi:hypothetical protein
MSSQETTAFTEAFKTDICKKNSLSFDLKYVCFHTTNDTYTQVYADHKFVSIHATDWKTEKL